MSEELTHVLDPVVPNTTGVVAAVAVGDTVQLKSGGPEMVVTAIADGMAECTWAHPAGHVDRAILPHAAIRPTAS